MECLYIRLIVLCLETKCLWNGYIIFWNRISMKCLYIHWNKAVSFHWLLVLFMWFAWVLWNKAVLCMKIGLMCINSCMLLVKVSCFCDRCELFLWMKIERHVHQFRMTLVKVLCLSDQHKLFEIKLFCARILTKCASVLI